jgi:hypothetical protein
MTSSDCFQQIELFDVDQSGEGQQPLAELLSLYLAMATLIRASVSLGANSATSPSDLGRWGFEDCSNGWSEEASDPSERMRDKWWQVEDILLRAALERPMLMLAGPAPLLRIFGAGTQQLERLLSDASFTDADRRSELVDAFQPFVALVERDQDDLLIHFRPVIQIREQLPDGDYEHGLYRLQLVIRRASARWRHHQRLVSIPHPLP